MLARTWHAALFNELPPPDPDQWAERGVVASTASWTSAGGRAGAEIDMSEAYDSINLSAASTALRHHGTPEAIVACLAQAWRAPRFCSVASCLAAPILPTAGIPAGDPPSTRVLGAMLTPWHRAVPLRCPGARTWAYVDDRSLKGDGHCTRPDQAVVDDALEVTADLDWRLGFTENLKKRQRWIDDELTEHLGIRAAPGAVAPPLPAPRDGWDKVHDLTHHLRRLPGSIETREKLGAVLVASTYRWAAPFLEVPPDSLVRSTFRSMVTSHCNLWCRRRYWADKLMAHPQYGTAVHSLRAARGLPDSPLLRAAAVAHASRLCMVPIWTRALGLLLRPAAGIDPRAAAAARSAALPGHHGAFDPASEQGQHALRIAARCRLLQPAPASERRNDEDGIQHVDVEASSAKAFADWRRSLGPTKRSLLDMWIDGAVWTPTRRRRSSTRSACLW